MAYSICNILLTAQWSRHFQIIDNHHMQSSNDMPCYNRDRQAYEQSRLWTFHEQWRQITIPKKRSMVEWCQKLSFQQHVRMSYISGYLLPSITLRSSSVVIMWPFQRLFVMNHFFICEQRAVHIMDTPRHFFRFIADSPSHWIDT